MVWELKNWSMEIHMWVDFRTVASMGKGSTSGATEVLMRDSFSRERGRVGVSGRELMEIIFRDSILKT